MYKMYDTGLSSDLWCHEQWHDLMNWCSNWWVSTAPFSSIYVIKKGSYSARHACCTLKPCAKIRKKLCYKYDEWGKRFYVIFSGITYLYSDLYMTSKKMFEVTTTKQTGVMDHHRGWSPEFHDSKVHLLHQGIHGLEEALASFLLPIGWLGYCCFWHWLERMVWHVFLV